jgi:hypothetical protein
LGLAAADSKIPEGPEAGSTIPVVALKSRHEQLIAYVPFTGIGHDTWGMDRGDLHESQDHELLLFFFFWKKT